MLSRHQDNRRTGRPIALSTLSLFVLITPIAAMSAGGEGGELQRSNEVVRDSLSPGKSMPADWPALPGETSMGGKANQSLVIRKPSAPADPGPWLDGEKQVRQGLAAPIGSLEGALARHELEGRRRQNIAIEAVSHSIFNSGWSMNAHTLGKGGRGVKVAILDGLVRCAAFNMVTERCTDKYNDYIDQGFAPAISFFDLHGTHVAGLIGGIDPWISGGEAGLLVGPAPESQLISYPIFDDLGFNYAALTWSINNAVSSGVKVMNNSWGPGAPGKLIERSDLLAFSATNIRSKILVVFAGGNDSANVFLDPHSTFSASGLKNFTNILWVGALAPNGTSIASYSNKPGTGCFKVKSSTKCTKDNQFMYFWMVAPGSNAISYNQNGSLTYLDGTSMAAPVVSGAAALIYSRWPELSPKQVRQILFASADDLGAKGVDSVFGHGRLNISAAMGPIGATIAKGKSGKRLTVGRDAFIKGIHSPRNNGNAFMVYDRFDRDFSSVWYAQSVDFIQDTPTTISKSGNMPELRLFVGPFNERAGKFNVNDIPVSPSSGIGEPGWTPIALSQTGFSLTIDGAGLERRRNRSERHKDLLSSKFFSEDSILDPMLRDYRMVSNTMDRWSFAMLQTDEQAEWASTSSGTFVQYKNQDSYLTLGVMAQKTGVYGVASSKDYGFSEPTRSVFAKVSGRPYQHAPVVLEQEFLRAPSASAPGSHLSFNRFTVGKSTIRLEADERTTLSASYKSAAAKGFRSDLEGLDFEGLISNTAEVKLRYAPSKSSSLQGMLSNDSLRGTSAFVSYVKNF